MRNRKKNDYLHYIKKNEAVRNPILSFIKSKYFIFIAAGAAVIFTIFFVLNFRTAKQIQKLIFNEKFDRAIIVARNYLENNKNTDVSRLLGEALFIKTYRITNEDEIRQNKEEIKKIFKELTKNSMENSAVLFMYGFLLVESTEERDFGVDLLKKALQLNKKDGEIGAYINRRIIVINGMPFQLVDVYERIAAALYLLKRYREAIEYYNLSLKTRPKTIHYFFLAMIYKELNLMDQAVKYVNIVLKTENNKIVQAKCYLLLAHIEYNRNNMDEAEKIYKKTLEFDSQCADSYYFLGKIYRKKKNFTLFNLYMRKAAKAGHEQAQKLIPACGLNRHRR